MEFNDEIMHRVWDTEQEILDVVHEICMNNNLKYSLFYGTLLGAVRHGGFIPWDDDIDIAMPRKDYNKLIQIWSEEAPAGYLLQTYNTDDDVVNNFTKIRKDHTTYLQDDMERSRSYHKGIFVDIFPIDRLAPLGISRTLQYVAGAVNLLMTRGYTSGTGGIIGVIERVLLRLPKSIKRSLRNHSESYFCRWNDNKELFCLNGSTIQSCKIFYPKELFDELVAIDFRDRKYCAVKQQKEYLTAEYGDYLQLPPEEERVWKHHPIIIDFDHNYEEIKDL